MLAPIFNSIATLLSRLSAARAGYLDNLNQFAGSYFTASRGAKLDNLDAAITSRAVATTALSNATWTDTKAAYLDAAISSRMGGIKGIQRGTVTIANDATSGTATITSVTTSKSELRMLGQSGGASSTSFKAAANCVRIELTNATTITATRALAETTSIVVSWELTEYN